MKSPFQPFTSDQKYYIRKDGQRFTEITQYDFYHPLSDVPRFLSPQLDPHELFHPPNQTCPPQDCILHACSIKSLLSIKATFSVHCMTFLNFSY